MKDEKTIGIVSYLTIIGFVIAFIFYSKNKTEYAAFHIRQMLGLILAGIALNIIGAILKVSMLSFALSLFIFILWVIGFIGAIQGNKNAVPVLGDKFQEWFKSI